MKIQCSYFFFINKDAYLHSFLNPGFSSTSLQKNVFFMKFSYFERDFFPMWYHWHTNIDFHCLYNIVSQNTLSDFSPIQGQEFKGNRIQKENIISYYLGLI